MEAAEHTSLPEQAPVAIRRLLEALEKQGRSCPALHPPPRHDPSMLQDTRGLLSTGGQNDGVCSHPRHPAPAPAEPVHGHGWETEVPMPDTLEACLSAQRCIVQAGPGLGPAPSATPSLATSYRAAATDSARAGGSFPCSQVTGMLLGEKPLSQWTLLLGGATGSLQWGHHAHTHEWA